MLPNCIVNGVAKSGTTAIYNYLKEHPEIFMSERKELNYFAYDPNGGNSPADTFPVTTLQDYEKEFEKSADFRVRGEASPAYFSVTTSAARIHSLIPDVKLITSLRNPVDRAYSGYLMHVRNGKASLDIENSFSPDKHWVKLGFYADKLRSIYNTFPREQLKIVLQEELKGDTARTMKGLYEFLGVDAEFQPNIQVKHNVGTLPKNEFVQKIIRKKELVKSVVEPITPHFAKKIVWKLEKLNQSEPQKLPEQCREDLKNLYRQDILIVEELIERDLSRWYS